MSSTRNLSSAPAPAPGQDAPDVVVSPVDEACVARLASARGGTRLSLLLPTTPAPRMHREDGTAMLRLASRVARRLHESDDAERHLLLNRLEEAMTAARRGPTQLGLGVFVDRDRSDVVLLPVTVQPKAVVEATFATRDLIRALHRTPPHLVVVLDRFGTRFFRVTGDRLRAAGTVDRVPEPSRVGASGTGPKAMPLSLVADDDDYLTRVQRHLGSLREELPSPVVLAGTADLVETFAARSHLQRLAGTVVDEEATDPALLFAAAALRLHDYLDGRGRDALRRLLDAAERTPGRVVSGLDGVRSAVASSPRGKGMLLVEQSFAHPGPQGTGQPRHDLVDDLIEEAIDAGHLLAFVEDDALADLGHIAVLYEPGADR